MSCPHTPPTFKESAFNCPHCNAYSKMQWDQMFARNCLTPVYQANCTHCSKCSYWMENPAFYPERAIMLFPSDSSAPLPHCDLPQSASNDFEETRMVVSKSPRAAAALLRLSLEKLCHDLADPKASINENIKRLVANGLSADLQKALDIVRVIGNNAVHPGELSSDDLAQDAYVLFELINHIAEEMIAKPKKIQSFYEKLPERARASIERRDGNANG